MKILMIHNYLRPPSGENTVFEQESELLQSKGHGVVVYTRHNDEIEKMGGCSKALIPFRAIRSSVACSDLMRIMEKEKPDIVHFHNIFPLISPAAYRACKKVGVPVVQTLHNYRIVCPGALLFRNNRVCEECAGMKFFSGIKYGCYRQSSIQTAGMAAIINFHRVINTWKESVDLYIALSDFAAVKYGQLGFPSESFFVKTNFLQNPVEPRYTDQGYGIYIGRLGEEKGVDTMLSALRNCPDMPFKVIGDGPVKELFLKTIDEYGLKNVEYLGVRDHEECMKYLLDARFLVLPSQCYEGVPMVLLEAMSAGKPAIVSDVGVLPLMVEDGLNGLTFSPGAVEELTEKMKRMYQHPDEARLMGKNSRAIFEERYTSEVNYRMLMEAYQKAIDMHDSKSKRKQ
jgi:glycosyltransferase involved in cell wall biosynthesis